MLYLQEATIFEEKIQKIDMVLKIYFAKYNVLGIRNDNSKLRKTSSI